MTESFFSQEGEPGSPEGGRNCTPPAIDDFPGDLFTDAQRRAGAVTLHLVASLYLFLALALVCDKYFVPAVERICEALKMSNDVAGATFMAAATSAPELFVNVIGTFITEGDIGLGTIVGSAVFNILAVAACCGLCAGAVIPLHWWPLTRDCLAYGLTVTLLIAIIHDERVEWYEALVLVLCYILYIAVMYWDKKIRKGCTKLPPPSPSNVVHHHASPDVQEGEGKTRNGLKPSEGSVQDAEKWRVLGFPYRKEWWRKAGWLVVLPIHSVFLATIPDCERPRFRKWYPVTFLMCIVWIGGLSYVVAWMITIVGDTLRIPDSVMGITFLAAGTSVPEAVSSVIVAKQGHGLMGISNSLGSNTFDILLCLGLPWLIKASFLPSSAGRHFVGINSRGLEYSAISLLSTLLLLYVAFAANKFRLDKRVGLACLVMYLLFLVLASLIELNFFFTVNLPTCGR